MGNVFKYLFLARLQKVRKIRNIITTVSIIMIISSVWLFSRMLLQMNIISGWKLSLVSLLVIVIWFLLVIASDVVPFTSCYVKRMYSTDRLKHRIDRQYYKYQIYLISGIENILWFLFANLLSIGIFYYFLG